MRRPVPRARRAPPVRQGGVTSDARRVALAALLAAALLPAGAAAQRAPAGRFMPQPPAPAAGPRAVRPMPPAIAPGCCGDRDTAVAHAVSIPRLVLGGVLGGIGGLVVGGLIGSRFDNHSNCPGEICDANGAFVGAGVGEVIAVPLGVHLANHRRGSLPYDYAISGGGLLAAGLVFGSIAAANENFGTAASLALPVVQIASAVWAERRKTH